MTTAAQRRFCTLAGALLGITMLLQIHRTWGIDHDATLYLGLALKQRWPQIYSHDLFFTFGSQGDYTLFPWLLGKLLVFINPVPLFKWGGLFGLLLFACTSWYCISKLLIGPSRYWAWLGIICLPSGYGQANIFSYAEPFLTPRTFSEAFCLLAIGLSTQKKFALATIALLAAAAFHPLQALAGSIVLWVWLVLTDKRWLHALWLSVLALVAGFIGLAPFDGLVHMLDPYWFSELDNLHQHLFVTNWPHQNLEIMAFDALMLVYAWHAWKDSFGKWCLAAITALYIGMLGSLILVDGLHLILPTGLQLWRVHWLAHWLAMAAFGNLLFTLHRDGDALRSLLLFLIGLLAWGAFNWVWLPFALLFFTWQRLQRYLRPSIQRLLFVALIGALFMLLANHAALAWLEFGMHGYRIDAYPIDKMILSYPIIALGLPLLLIHLWGRTNNRRRLVLAALILLPLSVASAARWDVRTPIRRAVEANALHNDVFGIVLPEDAQVFWEGTTILQTWLVLQRSDYYDPQQLSGIAFQRGTIHLARARITKLTPLLDSLEACARKPITDVLKECVIPDEVIAAACSRFVTLPPDFLVLQHRLKLPASGQWTLKDPMTNESLVTYWLYDCSRMTQLVHSAAPPAPEKYPQRLY